MGLGRRAKNFKVDYGDVCLGQSLERDRCLNYTLKQSPGATWWVLLDENPLHVGGGMDRSAHDFLMPGFWQQITPLRYTVLDWDQAREIPAISYLT